jgi:hypothetical protein
MFTNFHFALICAATSWFASTSGTTYNSDVTIGDLGDYIYQWHWHVCVRVLVSVHCCHVHVHVWTLPCLIQQTIFWIWTQTGHWHWQGHTHKHVSDFSAIWRSGIWRIRISSNCILLLFQSRYFLHIQPVGHPPPNSFCMNFYTLALNFPYTLFSSFFFHNPPPSSGP